MAAGSSGPLVRSTMIPPDLAHLHLARQFVSHVAGDAGFAPERVFDITLACSEAVANAIEHAPVKGRVELRTLLYPDRLECQIEGPGDFQAPNRAQERQTRGLGLPLMAKLSDHLALYSRLDGGTLVGLTFYLPGAQRPYEDETLPPSVREIIESNHLTSAIANMAPVGLCILDPELRYRWANPAYQALLDEPYRSGDLLGRRIGDVVPGAEESGALLELREASATGVVPAQSVSLVSGLFRGPAWWEQRALPLTGDGGGPPYDLLLVVSDETEHRRAEHRVRLDRALFQGEARILEQALSSESDETLGEVCLEVAVETTDSEIGFLGEVGEDGLLHDLALSVGGWEACRRLTAHGELKPPGNFPIRGLYGWVLTQGKSLVANDPGSHPASEGIPKGHALLRSFLGVPLKRGDATFGMIAVANRPGGYDAEQQEMLEALAPVVAEALDRKRAEKALRETERKNAELICHAPTPFFEVDLLRLRFTYANDAMCAMTGYTRDELLGMDPLDLIDEASRDLFRVRMEDWRRGEAPDPQVEFKVRQKDGGVVYASLDVTLTRDGDGNPLTATVVGHDVTERTLAEEAVRESEERLKRSQAIAHLGSWELDLATNELTWSDEVYRIFGLVPQEFGSTYQAFLDYVHPDDRETVEVAYSRSIAEDRDTYEIDHRIVQGSTGEVRWVREKCSHFRDLDGTIVRSVGMVHDITEHKRAEELSLRATRTLRALSDSNQALVRMENEREFLQEACRIIVDDCGHVMAWVGFAEDDDKRCIRPIVSAGLNQGYLETLELTWADTERGRGPSGTAVREGAPNVCPDMINEPRFAPWREEARKRGYASSVAVPLKAQDRVFGVLTIYSRDRDPFSEEEVNLLVELASDISVGIQSFRLRAAHDAAEEERRRLLDQERALTKELARANRELRSQAAQLALANAELETRAERLAASEEELQAQNEALRASTYNRNLIEAALDPLVTISPQGKIMDVNHATVGITGRSRSELIGTDFSDNFTDPERAAMGYQEVFKKGWVVDYPLTIRARDGKLTDVLYNASLYKDEDGTVLGVFAAARDVTALKQLEEQRHIAGTLQEALLAVPANLPGIRTGHLYRSATEAARIGGDFYDLFLAKDGRIVLLVGDVSGHGVEAAHTATFVKDVIQAFVHQSVRPQVVLNKTNDLLVAKAIPGFVSLWLGILDPRGGNLHYASAGHPYPLLRRVSGEVLTLESPALPLGAFPDVSWNSRVINLEVGDLLLLYTDGVTEARRGRELFGSDRLRKVLSRKRISAERLPDLVLARVLAFSGGALQDDVAMLALTRTSDEPSDGESRRPPG